MIFGIIVLLIMCCSLTLICSVLHKSRTAYTKRYYTLLDEHTQLAVRLDKTVIKYNELVIERNLLVRQLRNTPHTNTTTQASPLKGFSDAELKLIRYYLHPDKHQGKTSELVAKLNQQIKG